MAFDLESNGMHAYRATACIIQLAWPTTRSSSSTRYATSLAPLGELLASPDTEKIVHDVAFDARILAEAGVFARQRARHVDRRAHAEPPGDRPRVAARERARRAHRQEDAAARLGASARSRRRCSRTSPATSCISRELADRLFGEVERARHRRGGRGGDALSPRAGDRRRGRRRSPSALRAPQGDRSRPRGRAADPAPPREHPRGRSRASSTSRPTRCSVPTCSSRSRSASPRRLDDARADPRRDGRASRAIDRERAARRGRSRPRGRRPSPTRIACGSRSRASPARSCAPVARASSGSRAGARKRRRSATSTSRWSCPATASRASPTSRRRRSSVAQVPGIGAVPPGARRVSRRARYGEELVATLGPRPPAERRGAAPRERTEISSSSPVRPRAIVRAPPSIAQLPPGVRAFGMGGGALAAEGVELVADLRDTTALGVAEVARRALRRRARLCAGARRDGAPQARRRAACKLHRVQRAPRRRPCGRAARACSGTARLRCGRGGAAAPSRCDAISIAWR